MWRWFRLGLAGTALVLLLVALGLPSRTDGPTTVGRAAIAGSADAHRPIVRTHEAPSLAVDRDNPMVVYLSDVDLTTGACHFSVSIDGGVTWRSEVAPELDPWTRNCAMGSGRPQNVRTELHEGPDDTLSYVFQGNDPDAGGSRAVLLARSRDGGRSWSTILVDAGPVAATPEEVEVNFQGHLAVDPKQPSVVYVMWRRAFPQVDPAVRARPSQAFFATSRDGGATFSPPAQLPDIEPGGDGPRPLIVGGTVYAFYRQVQPPLPVGDAGPAPTPPLTRLFVAASRDQGRTWARAEIAAARDAGEPVPAYDPDRKLFYAVWHDNRQEELDIWFSSSPDAVTWSPPTLLNDDPRGTRVGQHFPQLSLSPNGRIDVAWYDWRDDPFPAPTVGGGNVLSAFGNRGKVASVYLTTSRDGGRTWARNVRVNDQLIDRTVGTWANNYDVVVPPAIASLGNGALVAWSDTRNATYIDQSQDIAVATVTYGTAKAVRITGIQAALAGTMLGLGVAMWVALLIVRPGSGRRRPPRPQDRSRRSGHAGRRAAQGAVHPPSAGRFRTGRTKRGAGSGGHRTS
ncbi:MAG: sialidase family protein [Acidimicrobiales bacterium]